MNSQESFSSDEPARPNRSSFSVMQADQEEINVRFAWIAQEENFKKIEWAVVGSPSPLDRLRKIGGIALHHFSHITPSSIGYLFYMPRR